MYVDTNTFNESGDKFTGQFISGKSRCSPLFCKIVKKVSRSPSQLFIGNFSKYFKIVI